MAEDGGGEPDVSVGCGERFKPPQMKPDDDPLRPTFPGRDRCGADSAGAVDRVDRGVASDLDGARELYRAALEQGNYS